MSMYMSTTMTESAEQRYGRAIGLFCTMTGDLTSRLGISIPIITEDTSLSAWVGIGPWITAIPVITGMAATHTIGMAIILLPAKW